MKTRSSQSIWSEMEWEKTFLVENVAQPMQIVVLPPCDCHEAKNCTKNSLETLEKGGMAHTRSSMYGCHMS